MSSKTPKKKERPRNTYRWAAKKLEEMAAEETNPVLKAFWLRGAARGYEIIGRGGK